MKKTCEYCGHEFEAKRSTARFCSDAHRTQNAYAEKNGVAKPIAWSSFNFQERYSEQLDILNKLSGEAGKGLGDVATEFGYKVAVKVLSGVVIPLYEDWRVAYNELLNAGKSGDPPQATPARTWKWSELSHNQRHIIGEIAVFGFYYERHPYRSEAHGEFFKEVPSAADELVTQGILNFNDRTDTYEFVPGVSVCSFERNVERSAASLLP